MNRDRLTLLVVAGGFAMTFLEVRVLHGDVVREETTAWIPLVLTPILTLACLVALAKAQALRTVAVAVLALGALAGFVGLYKHTDGLKASKFAPLFSAQPLVAKADEGEQEGRENQAPERSGGEKAEDEGVPPPLAPMGITGLAMIGLIAARRRES